MEAIQQARKLYIKCHHHQASLTDKDKQQLEADIQRFITIAIKEVTSKDLFENVWMLVILKGALQKRANENSDVMPVARAFGSLEKYFLLIVEQPWKPEFKEIKTYGGFFRTKIKAFLPNCEEIFKKAGYAMPVTDYIMKYKGPVDKTSLLLLAFDCRVALVECKTIADHYNKVKGLSMSLTDAVSNILHEEYSREISPKHSMRMGNGSLLDSSSSNSNVVYSPNAPPALPKREPITNGSNLDPRCDQVYKTYGERRSQDPNLDMLERRYRVMHPPNSPQRMYLAAPTKSPLTPSAVTSEAFAYIDAPAEEIIPELPQGTCDEHMRESLKLVNLNDVPRPTAYSSSGLGAHSGEGIPKSDDWKWFREMQGNGSVPAPHHARITPSYVNTPSVSSPVMSVAGAARTGNGGMPAPSMEDEGIEQDIYPPGSRSYQSNAKYNSIAVGSQGVTPPRGTPSFGLQPVSDQGYRTEMHSNNVNTCIPNVHPSTYQQIYHPPNISTDGSGPALSGSLAHKPRMAPPPIPSRTLKPKTVVEEDSMDGKSFRSAPNIPVPPSSSLSATRSPKSVPPILAQQSNTEPIMRREKLVAGKSNSLKYGGDGGTLLRQVSKSRTARSMDMTSSEWVCKMCTSVNTSSDNVCAVCSHSRQGPDVSHPAFMQVEKPCPSCTFQNEAGNTHCAICAAKLPAYTYDI